MGKHLPSLLAEERFRNNEISVSPYLDDIAHLSDHRGTILCGEEASRFLFKKHTK